MNRIWVFSEDPQAMARVAGLARSLTAGPEDLVEAVAVGPAAVDPRSVPGVTTIYHLKGENPWPESYAEALARLAAERRPDLILAAATPRGKDITATVAATLQAALVTEAFAVRRCGSGFETDRLMYGGLAVCTESLGEMSLVTVPAGNFEPAEPLPETETAVVPIDVLAVSRAVVGEVCPITRSGADIASAERVVCVGRGVARKEDLKLAEDLAGAIGAAVGCTRSIAEDFGWMPEETYIGLSGQKIRPRLYISLGVSGQVQHVSGIRDSKVIVGIDSNENAPIFAAADFGIVGNLYEVAPLLTAALKARSG